LWILLQREPRTESRGVACGAICQIALRPSGDYHRLNSQQFREIFGVDRFDLARLADTFNQLISPNKALAECLDGTQRKMARGVQQIRDHAEVLLFRLDVGIELSI